MRGEKKKKKEDIKRPAYLSPNVSFPKLVEKSIMKSATQQARCRLNT